MADPAIEGVPSGSAVPAGDWIQGTALPARGLRAGDELRSYRKLWPELTRLDNLFLAARARESGRSAFSASTIWPSRRCIICLTARSSAWRCHGLLLADPLLLVLFDEPSAGLDPPGRLALGALLGDLPATMVIATHDLDFAAGLLCTRFLVLDRADPQARRTHHRPQTYLSRAGARYSCRQPPGSRLGCPWREKVCQRRCPNGWRIASAPCLNLQLITE